MSFALMGRDVGHAEHLDYPSLDPSAIDALVIDALAEADRLVDVALGWPPDDTTGFLERLDDIVRLIAAARGRAAFPRSVDPHAERRRAAERAFTNLELWRQALVRRDDLAAAIARAAAMSDALDVEQRAVVALWQVDLRDAGAGLPSEVRGEVRILRERLLELSTAFVARLGEPPSIEVTSDELAGLPAHVLAGLEAGTEPGTVRVPMTDAVCIGVLENVPDRAVRERVARGLMNRGGDPNRQALAEAARIRRTLATRLGYGSWADLRTAPLIAGDAAAVERFLADLSARLEGLVLDERRAMRDVLAADLGVAPQAVEVEDWDWRYVDHLQRAALGADAGAVRDYLGFEDVLAGMVAVIDETFGVRLEARPARLGWHPDVRGFDLVDSASGALLATVLLDPYQRDGKTVGAWMDVLDPGSRVVNADRPPVIVLCTNATPPAEGSALLTPDEASTLFHEFGHVVHFALSLQCSRYWLASDAWMQMDWVESPSIFLGSWGTKRAVLARFARHHRTAEPIPHELLAGLRRADRLNLATRTLRQVCLAAFDQAIHGPGEVDVEEANRAAWAVRRIPFPEGTFWFGSSAHLMDGYDATYYGYLWADALSDDLMTPFREAGYLSTDVGGRYRSQVLEQPVLVNPLDGVGRFLGREPSNEAYFARIAGTRGDDL